jgi:hypothetical protein
VDEMDTAGYLIVNKNDKSSGDDDAAAVMNASRAATDYLIFIEIAHAPGQAFSSFWI